MSYQISIGGFNRARGTAASSAVNRTSLGGAFQAAGRTAGSLGAQMIDQADSLRMSKAQTQFKADVDTRVATLDPTNPEYQSQVEEIYQGASEEALSSASPTRSSNSERMNAWLENQTTAGRAIAIANQRQGLAEAAVTEFEALSMQTLDQVRRDPDGHAAYQEEMDEALASFAEAIPPEAQAELEKDYQRRAVEAVVEGLAQAGRHKEAQEAIAQNSDILTGGQRRGLTSLQKGIESQQRTERRAAFARRFADVEVAILEAGDFQGLQSARTLIDGLEAQGAFVDSPGAKPQLLRQLQAKQKGLVSQTRDEDNIMAKLERGLGLDSQKEADVGWKHYSATIGEDTSPADLIEHMVSYTEGSTIAPKELNNLIARGERADSAEQLAMSSLAIERLAERAPSAWVKSGDDSPRANLVNALVTTGFDREEAARLVIDRSKDQAAIKQRKEEFNDVFDGFDFRESLVDQMSTGIFPFSSGPEPAQIPAGKVQEYRRGVSALYRLTGDMDTSLQAAATQLQRRSSLSDLAGGAVVDFPAEATFPNSVGLDGTQIKDVVRADVEATLSSLNVPNLEGDFGGKMRWRLVPDERTKRDMREGKAPSYRIETMQFPVDGEGVYMPQYVMQDGQEVLARWRQFTADDLSSDTAFQEMVDKQVGVGRRQRQIEGSVTPEDQALELRGF